MRNVVNSCHRPYVEPSNSVSLYFNHYFYGALNPPFAPVRQLYDRHKINVTVKSFLYESNYINVKCSKHICVSFSTFLFSKDASPSNGATNELSGWAGIKLKINIRPRCPQIIIFMSSVHPFIPLFILLLLSFSTPLSKLQMNSWL